MTVIHNLFAISVGLSPSCLHILYTSPLTFKYQLIQINGPNTALDTSQHENMKMFSQEIIWLDKSILGNDFHMVVNYNGEEKLQISFPGNGSFCNRG